MPEVLQEDPQRANIEADEAATAGEAATAAGEVSGLGWVHGRCGTNPRSGGG